jgi:hypothetical protein
MLSTGFPPVPDSDIHTSAGGPCLSTANDPALKMVIKVLDQGNKHFLHPLLIIQIALIRIQSPGVKVMPCLWVGQKVLQGSFFVTNGDG